MMEIVSPSPAEMDLDPDLAPEPSRVDRKAAWASGIAAAVFLLIASWFGWHAAHEPVRWGTIGFHVESATEASVTYAVYLYSDSDAVCRVSALNEHHAVVGYADAMVLRSAGTEQRITTTVTTTEPAVSVYVAYCEAE